MKFHLSETSSKTTPIEINLLNSFNFNGVMRELHENKIQTEKMKKWIIPKYALKELVQFYD